MKNTRGEKIMKQRKKNERNRKEKKTSRAETKVTKFVLEFVLRFWCFYTLAM